MPTKSEEAEKNPFEMNYENNVSCCCCCFANEKCRDYAVRYVNCEGLTEKGLSKANRMRILDLASWDRSIDMFNSVEYRPFTGTLSARIPPSALWFSVSWERKFKSSLFHNIFFDDRFLLRDLLMCHDVTTHESAESLQCLSHHFIRLASVIFRIVNAKMIENFRLRIVLSILTG